MSPGDEILAVNNYRLDRLDADQIVELLTESKQKPAQLVVRRPGNVRLLDLELTPEDMKSSSVERVFALQPGIGYIRVSGFEETTAREIHDGIEKLGGRNLKGLVLDLRNNPGGLMTSALRNGFVFSQARTGDSFGERAQRPGDHREGSGRQQAIDVPRRGDRERQDGERIRDRFGRAAGSRPRHHRRRAELRQRPGAERVSRCPRTPGWRSPRRSTTSRAAVPSRRPSARSRLSGRTISRWERRPRIPMSAPISRPTAGGPFPAAAASCRISKSDPALLTRFRAVLEAIRIVYDVRHRVHPRPQNHGRLGRDAARFSISSRRGFRSARFNPRCASGSRTGISSSGV